MREGRLTDSALNIVFGVLVMIALLAILDLPLCGLKDSLKRLVGPVESLPKGALTKGELSHLTVG